ncbi:hypothetical protein Q7C36_017556 [Tachysurus vachellii]|uniref:Uncharacterized protein n=1 Tax=Tachysurus vachellii TaxID=175792 RepID=A0AA88M3B1_TACVA|nr:hypothetical protein Q7C36_017556 [Tachysurus vachellii]
MDDLRLPGNDFRRKLGGRMMQLQNKQLLTLTVVRGYSSVVEHLTADQEVPGSNPGAPSTREHFDYLQKTN